MTLRPAHYLAIACCAAGLAGCELKDDPAMAASRTAGPIRYGTPASARSASTPALPTVDVMGYDTLAGIPVPQIPAVRMGSGEPAGSALDATSSDLAALRLGLVVPVQGFAAARLRDSFDEKRGERVHEAIDILAPRGTPVVSATSGRVLKLHQSKAGGTMVYAADATDRFILLYGHLETYAPGLREGAVLVPGQQIGAVGTTGNAGTTPHLHFAVMRGRPSAEWWRGTPVNPYPLFQR